MGIPGIDALYNILKRHIERGNDVLAQRKELAQELHDACRTWSRLLVEMIDDAVGKWQDGRKKAAAEAVMALEMDFQKLDYWSLESTSPIVLFLQEDDRFGDFAAKCVGFYKSALYVKRLLHGGIRDRSGVHHSSHGTPLPEMARLWREEVEDMLRKVVRAYHQIKTITPA